MVQNLYDYWKLKNSCVGHAKAFCKWKFSMLGSQPCSYKKFIWALESLYFWVCWFSDVNWEYPRCFSVEVIGHKIWMLYKLERLVGPKPNVISKSQSLVHGGIAQKIIGSLWEYFDTWPILRISFRQEKKWCLALVEFKFIYLLWLWSIGYGPKVVVDIVTYSSFFAFECNLVYFFYKIIVMVLCKLNVLKKKLLCKAELFLLLLLELDLWISIYSSVVHSLWLLSDVLIGL